MLSSYDSCGEGFACYSSRVEYLASLNERQKEAVLATEGPVSVLAGAGSGKTKVLTTRIFHLMRQGVPGNRILAVTFTNKAAREMRERLARMLGMPYAPRYRGASDELPFVATFHGLGREILETHGSVIGIPRHFSIFDRGDSERTVRALLKEMNIDPKEVPTGYILARISKAKGQGLSPETFREKEGRTSFRSRVVSEVWPRYQATLREEKALDFDDLISIPTRLLREHADVRRAMHERFRYIHVDEYQDTSTLQEELVGLLTSSEQNLFVVGDIDQCIYTWRQATMENLLEFETRYPNAKTIVLEHNYRSTRTIVEAANAIIEKNKNRKEKRSVTDNPPGEKILIHFAGTAEQEAAWIAEETERALHAGSAPEEIAVLFRTNVQSRAIEEAFLAHSIPYRLLGTRFFDRKEVKDVLSWVRLSLDPTREADLMRAVQSPPRGIGKVTLGKLTAGKRGTLKPNERAKVEALERTVAELSETAKEALPSAFVKLLLEKSGIEADLKKDGEEGQERLENAQELVTLASRYDAMPGVEGLTAFLADAALAGDQDELDRNEKKNGVTLMTVHAAKGLEFDLVFVSGMEEGLFPHEGHGEEERDEEEERRLFYVAMTRAKKRLVLTLARVRRIYGTDYLSEPSSFLHDLDPSYVRAGDWLDENVIEA